MHGPRAALALPVLALVGIALAGCGAGKAEPAPAVDCDSIQTFGYIRQQMNAADNRIDSVRTSLPDADPATQRLALSQEYSSLGSEYGALAHLAADEGGGGGLPWRLLVQLLQERAQAMDGIATVLFDSPGIDARSADHRRNVIERETASLEETLRRDEELTRETTEALRARGFEERDGRFLIDC